MRDGQWSQVEEKNCMNQVKRITKFAVLAAVSGLIPLQAANGGSKGSTSRPIIS